MMGRGEFAFLIAAAIGQLQPTEDIPESMIAQVHQAVLWALVLNTLVAPILFRIVLFRYYTTGEDPSCMEDIGLL